MIDSASAPIASARPVASTQARATASLAALAFGLLLFLAAGFAAPSMIHNAAHDMRHGFGLPCH